MDVLGKSEFCFGLVCYALSFLLILCHFVELRVGWQILRTGHLVLFHTPRKTPYVEIGMVTTIWRGVKKPRPSPGKTPIDNVVAFRVLSLQPQNSDESPPKHWRCNSKSIMWVVRLESLVTILDCVHRSWSAIEEKHVIGRYWQLLVVDGC